MENAVSVQTLELLRSALLGLAMGVVYDVFRVARTYTSGKRWIIGIFDAVFWIVSLISLFGFVLLFSGGHMRWYILLGIFCAFFVYRTTSSEIVYKVMKTSSDMMIKLLSSVQKPMYSFLSGAKQQGLRAARRAKQKRRNKRNKTKDEGDGNGNKKENKQEHTS